MKNLTVSLDERLLADAKRVAAAKGESLNKFVRDLIRRAVSPHAVDAEDDFFRIADELKLNSGGWKFNREEIYEDAF